MEQLAADVLHFWFGDPSSPEYGKPRAAWFRKDPAFDPGNLGRTDAEPVAAADALDAPALDLRIPPDR